MLTPSTPHIQLSTTAVVTACKNLKYVERDAVSIPQQAHPEEDDIKAKIAECDRRPA